MTDESWFDARHMQHIFLFSKACNATMKTTLPDTQPVPWGCVPGGQS
jgi:hypothetical protein